MSERINTLDHEPLVPSQSAYPRFTRLALALTLSNIASEKLEDGLIVVYYEQAERRELINTLGHEPLVRSQSAYPRFTRLALALTLAK